MSSKVEAELTIAVHVPVVRKEAKTLGTTHADEKAI